MKRNRTLFIRYAVMAAGLVGLVLLGGLFVVYNHRQHLAQDIRIYRYTLAQEGEALRQTYNQLSSISNLLVKNPVIINTLDRHLNGEEATEIAAGMVDRNLEAIAAIENVSTVFLVSLDGACLYSSRKEQVGNNYGSRDYVRNTLRTGSGFYAMLDVGTGRTGLYYAQAIKNGSLRIGVAVLEIRPNFFYLHNFTTPFTEEPPQPADSRIGLSTDGNILFNTTDSSLASLQPLPEGFLPENLPPQKAIELLDFPDYDREALFSSGFLQIENAEGTVYYLFHYPIVSRNLSLIHVISQDWFHSNYHPASSDYSGYLIMLGGMLCVMLGLLWMVNRRHSQVLLAAETLKQEAEQRIIEKEKYETIINRNPQGFWLNDFETGRILEVNQSLCRLLGREAEQIVGCLPAEFLLPEESGSGPASERRLNDVCQEGRLRLADGGAATVLINSSCIAVPGSEEKICFSFFADISERKREQEQLFLFSQAVEQSTSAIVITDRNARIAYVNPAFAELTGWHQEEAVGTEPAVLCAGERDTPLSREIWRRISGGGTWKGFLHCRRKDGSLYWEGQTVCPLYDDKGKISHYLAIKNDITRRLELERKFKAQLAKLELMVEHAAIGIAHVVHDRFAWASRAAAEMFGYSDWEEGAELPPIGSLFDNEEAYRTVLAAAQEAFSRDEVFHADQLMRRKDGSQFWCSLTGKMIDPGLPDQGAVWLTKDISRQKEEERQLQLAKERAEQASQAKTNFLASISHEIRTPMNAIIGMSNLALKSGLNKEQQEYVSQAKEAADLLMCLLDDIIYLASIDQNPQIETAPFELRTVIADAMQMVKCQAEEKKLRLSWATAADLPEFVAGDALLLRKILVNLLDNSIKFSVQGEISVAVVAEEQETEQLELTFTVRDEGIGIASEQLEHIFDIFYQIDTSLQRANSGPGIGLTICRRLCELMGGSIRAESELGKGSMFTFTILCGKISKEEEDRLKPSADNIRPMRILVVDDSKANRFVARSILEKDGHDISEAKDGLEALKLLTEEREIFDVVLMDVQMPVMDGLTVTKIIRACEQESCCLDNVPLPDDFREALHCRLKGKHLPVVALTAHNLKEDRQRCMDAGMDEYAVKPFQLKEIYHVIFKDISELIWQQRQQCCRSKQLISCACAAEQSQTKDATAMDRNGSDNGVLVAKVAAHLREMYQLEPEQVEQMVQISADSISETLKQAKEMLAAGDLAALSAAGHKAKGVLLGIGLEEAAELARQVELNGKAGQAADYSGLLDRLEEGLRPLLVLSGG